MGAQTENDVTVCGADCCGGPPVNFENTDYATEAAVTNPTSKCCEESSADGDRCCGSPPERTASTIPESHDKVAESACQDGCCSSKESVDNLGLAIDPHLLRSEQREQSAEVVRRDKCCPKKIIAIEDNCKDNCCASRQENECQGKCCPKDASTDEDDQEADSRTKEHNTSENDCKNNCCFDAHRLLEIDTKGTACNDRMDDPRKQNDTPDCCQGKQKPCCDGTCIDRIVSRECGIESDDSPNRSAKSQKRAVIRQQYTARLAAIGCICRALVALGKESCCATNERISCDSRQGRTAPGSLPHPKATRPEENYEGSAKNSRCRNSTDSEGKLSPCGKAYCKPGCRRTKNGTSRNAKPNASGFNTAGPQMEVYASADPEKGASGNERIVLSIIGMTCTGCETKLQRVLGGVPAVSGLKTSLIMARAEFYLDLRILSVESIRKHLERTTEFKCEQISTKGSTLEVRALKGTKEFIQQALPLGVNNIIPIGQDVVRINFDPQIIGARNLIERGLQQPSTLAPLSADPGLAAGSRHVRHLAYMTLFSCILTIPVLVLAWAPLPSNELAYSITSLVLATIIQFVVAGPFYPKAMKSLVFSRMIEMDLLIVLSTSAAYVFSVVSFGYSVSGQPLSTGQFFETSTLLVSLIMVGRWISALARQKAVESISFRSLQPTMAQLAMADGTMIAEIDTRLLQYGDIFCVLPEHRVPTDGIVIYGSSEMDESLLTGESRPVEKATGDRVISGSVNGSGKLLVRLTHLPSENTISAIAGMVDDAKLSKPRIQDIADKVASYFVPVVVLLTLITFIVWVAIGVRIRGQTGAEAAVQAITYTITVLIVSCPCAVGLAVPMVVVIGSGIAAEHGVIFKSARSIESAHRATHLVFDKTGTLTQGKMSVSETHYESQDPTLSQSKILGLVANSKHPVSVAVASELTTASKILPTTVDGVRIIPGKGIQGTIHNEVICGGNSRWLGLNSDPRVAAMLDKGYTVFCVTIGSRLDAIFGLSDTIRSDASATVSELKKRGIHVSLLSGDDDKAVSEIGAKLDFDPAYVRSRCSPKDKQDYIKDLQATSVNGRRATVIFVGDGTNDAVALVQADIGVHMDSGTDVAGSAADAVLMGRSLRSILTMMDISQASVQRIRFNFAWALVYNVLAILLASGALSAANGGNGVRIPPEYAGLGELVSVLPVIAIALGLKFVNFRVK